jgi:hypothetical protein
MRTLSLFAALSFATVAGAEELQVATPIGKTLTATKVTSPAPTSPEGVMQDSIAMITAGQFDAWIAKHCHPTMCPADPGAIEALKNYNLSTAKKTAGACVHDEGKTLLVTRRDASDTKVTVYVWCGDKRMPAPASVEKVGDAWKVTSFSW